MICIPYLSWNSGVFCKNSNPEWVARSSRRIGLKSDWYDQVENHNQSNKIGCLNTGATRKQNSISPADTRKIMGSCDKPEIGIYSLAVLEYWILELLCPASAYCYPPSI